jgi:hypothetical protein
LTLYRTNDGNFAGASTARALVPLVRVAIVIFAANPRLIDFNDAAESDFRLD